MVVATVVTAAAAAAAAVHTADLSLRLPARIKRRREIGLDHI